MRLIGFLFFMLSVGVNASENEIIYLCPPYAIESMSIVRYDGETMTDVNEMKKGLTKVEKYVLKTNWYNQPLYLNWYKKKNRPPLMMKSTQSKLEWIQNDFMIFDLDITERNGERIELQLSLEKGDNPKMISKMKMSSKKKGVGGSVTLTQRCFKQ